MNKIFIIAFLFLIISCKNNLPVKPTKNLDTTPFEWKNANLYFLLTDRFSNGNQENDISFDRIKTFAPERGFQGGDFLGIIEKLKSGYFKKLGVTALWFSPIFEQIHDGVDEGTGYTYAYHGYWIKDWTCIEPNFGTEEEFAQLVEIAHENGIRILMDIVLNHTGPVTKKDPYWGENWARTSPTCKYNSYESTVYCTLVDNLPDIKTESNEEVSLPPFLIEKWQDEGTLEEKLNSLDSFFNATKYPKAPRFYIIKWLIDYVRKYGIDGFRIDTAKHIEASVWNELAKEAQKAFDIWKKENPEKVLDDNDFYLIGEVYGYNISDGESYNNGGKIVNYFKEGKMQGLINFEFKNDASNLDYKSLFNKYDSILSTKLQNYSILNYITSHDDGQPYDKERKKNIEAGTKLLLCQGMSQIYYGDESSRNLIIENTQGDATLRGFMNWEEIENNYFRNDSVSNIFKHYCKLGNFRKNNPSVGAGKQTIISDNPFTFARNYVKGDYTNSIVVALQTDLGEKTINLNGTFNEGTILTDYYSGYKSVVQNNRIVIDSDYNIVLLGK